MTPVVPVQKTLTDACGYSSAETVRYQTMLMAEWSASGIPGGVYGLFQEMEDKDAHFFSTVQTRKNALLASPRKLIAREGEAGTRIAKTVQEILDNIPNFTGAIFHLLDAMAKGYSIAEVEWRINGGRVEVAGIHSRRQSDFAFDETGNLYRLNPCTPDTLYEKKESRPRLIPRPGELNLWHRGMRKMPERKFLHFAFQGGTGMPYGSPLAAKAYWYYRFKSNNLRQWALYNEKYGSPTAIARYSAGTDDNTLQRIADALENLPQDAGLLLPDTVSLEFLEARRASGSNTYQEMADWCNDEISKIVLGQTLTVSEGRRSGSLALAQVHNAVRHDYLESDAAALGQVLTHQLVRWITDFNFGTDAPAPELIFDCANPADFRAGLDLDRDLIAMGVSLPADYFYEKYRRPKPADKERAIRYDDQNLYQYHLHYGVLTINEIRETLGLAPVAWGNKPPAPASSAGSLPASLHSVGEGEETETDGGGDEGLRDRSLH